MGCLFSGTKDSGHGVALSVLALLASGVAPVAAQGVKLNGPLARGIHGNVSSVQCSPDGQRAVFFATSTSEGMALFSVPTKGGTAVELVDEITFNMPVRISPDSQFVHYLRAGLHVVPIDGGRAPLRVAEDALSFAYVPGSEVLLFNRATGVFAVSLKGGTPVPVAVSPAGTTTAGELSISADGRWVVFRAGSKCYSAAVDGSTGPLLLSDDSVHVVPGWLEITRDSQRVVYRPLTVNGLYSVPIDGSAAPVELNNPMPSNQRVTQFALGRDGSRVLYIADQDRRNTFELYSAPVAGGEPAIKLNAPLGTNRDVNSFLAADGGKVVYRANHAVDGVTELFLVGVAGPAAPVRLSHAAPAGASVLSYKLTPDGSRVVYELVGTVPRDIFSVSIRRPGVAQPLSEVASGESTFGFDISPDSARVAYLLEGPVISRLYSVPIGGGPRTPLHDEGFVEQSGGLFTPDSRRVLYSANQALVGSAFLGDPPEVFELFSQESAGGSAPVKLSPPLDDGIVLDDVTSFQFGPLGTRGTFVVDLWEDGCQELHGVQLEPRKSPVLLATTPRFAASPRSPSAVLISPDEEWVAYTMREGGDGGGYYWLFGVPMDGSRAPVQLEPLPVAGVRYGPDGRTLFYHLTGGATGLYRVPVDSSAPRQELTGWQLDDRSLPFELSADGSTLVVLVDALVEGEYELFSLPSDGSSPPVQLNDVSRPHGSHHFRITPDGTRVIYASDEVTDQTMELFSVPIDGSAAPMRISGPMPAGTVIWSLELVPEANRGVFVRYDRWPAVNQYELWSVPMDGSAPAVRLHAALPEGGDVDFAYRVVPGGTHVAFRADLAADERYELFLAPLDGSTAPRRLNGTLAAGGDVTAFELDGTGTRAVYRADEKQDEAFELFSAPLAAPATPLQITGPHVAGGDVTGFRTVPGGQHVVFTADHDTDDVFELYIAPVDRIKQARKLTGPLVDGGDVLPEPYVEPGGRVVYIADQDEDSVNEVYLTSPTLPREPAAPATPRAARR